MLIPASFTDRLPRSVLAREVFAATLGLLAGVALLPALIYGGGSALLGRYEGASLSRTYGTVLSGLLAGSIASWVIVLGPYALYLLLRRLRVLWRVGAAKPETSP